jgi:hypothetical protein
MNYFLTIDYTVTGADGNTNVSIIILLKILFINKCGNI